MARRPPIFMDDRVSQIDEQLEALAIRPKSLTLRELVAKMQGRIAAALKAGYGYEEVAEVFNRSGVEVKPSTVKRYYEDLLKAKGLKGRGKKLRSIRAGTETSVADAEIAKKQAAAMISVLRQAGLTLPYLAVRLNTTRQRITNKRNHPDFPEWAKALDPGGLSWEYRSESRRYYPVPVVVPIVEQQEQQPEAEELQQPV